MNVLLLQAKHKRQSNQSLNLVQYNAIELKRREKEERIYKNFGPNRQNDAPRAFNDVITPALLMKDAITSEQWRL